MLTLFIKIEGKLITSFLGLGVTSSQTVHIYFSICVQMIVVYELYL